MIYSMINERRLRFLAGTLLALAVTLAFASTANAKSFSMTGQWFANRSVLVDIPINGGPVTCFELDNESNCVGMGTMINATSGWATTMSDFPWPRPAGQVHFGFKPAGGGVPGSAAISAMGANPASFTIPDGAFKQFVSIVGPQAMPVALVPTVVQLNTSLDLSGPAGFATAAAATWPFTLGQPAVFMKDAWSNDPGQASAALGAGKIRAAPDFTWCPGIGGPLCAFPLGNQPGALNGVVRYEAGPNRFGGTMALLLKGNGTTTIVAGTTGGTAMVPLLAHLPFAMNPAFIEGQAQGIGYSFTNQNILGSAKLYIGFMTSKSTITPGAGLITSTGPPLMTTGGGTAVMPGDTNLNYGMPWTTGAVSVMNVELGPGSSPQTNTITANGAGHRTGAGKGSITLVAGGTSNRVVSGLDFANIELITLNFSDGTPTPSMGPAGLATVALLMALSAGYAIRRRFAAEV